MDNQMFFLHFLLYGMIAVNGMSVGQNNTHLSTNAWYDVIHRWLDQHELYHIYVDTDLKIQPRYSRCSGDPHGFVGNKNNNHDVLCFDVDGVDGNTYRLYEKSSDDVFEEFGCDHTDIQITCDGHLEEIQIVSATYGRTDDIECPGGPTFTTNCTLENAKEIVSDHCDGSPHCQFTVSTVFFQSDPCPGTSKYSFIEYTCVDTHVPKEFTVLASFKSMFPGSDDVIINEIQFCLNYITSAITVDLSKLSLDENGMVNEWSWGMTGVYYTTNGLTILNTYGNMFIITLTLPSGDYSFEIMRPGFSQGDYYLSIKAYANDLGGLMGQVHDYNIYSNSDTRYEYSVGEVNGNKKYFLVKKQPRGDIDCWYYMNLGNVVNAIYGDIAQYLQPTC